MIPWLRSHSKNMTHAPDTVLLRRYILERAAGRIPRKEYARYEAALGAWIRCDEIAARSCGRWKRVRRAGEPWCFVLGHQTVVMDDDQLQAYFATVPEDGWMRLGSAVQMRPAACLREWRESGARILDACSGTTTLAIQKVGSLSRWPAARGSGSRSLVLRS